MASAGGDRPPTRRHVRIPLQQHVGQGQQHVRIPLQQHVGQGQQRVRIPLQQHVGQGQRVRIPLPRAGQQITITLSPGQRAPAQGGARPLIRVIPVRLSRQPGGVGEGSNEDILRAVREQEEAARRVAEDNHRRAQLRTALSSIQPPLAEYSSEEGVVRVSWQPVEVAGSDAVEYTVSGWKDGAGDPASLYRGQLTSCVVTTAMLCRGHTHQVAVCAEAGGQSGELSRRSEVEVPALAPDQPLPPKIASRTKSSLGIRWNAPADNGATISEYCLEWDQGTGEFVQLFSGKAKQFKWNHKFQPGSHAHFRLRARNAIGWSEDSREATFSALQAAPPAPLHPSLSSSTPHSLTLHWAPPTEAASITAYCLEMDDPHSGYGFCPVYQGDGLSYTCRDLQRVTGYSFRLTASNEAGSSPASPPITFTTLPDSPGVPGAVCLHDRPQSTSLSIAWSPPTNDGGSPIQSYILQVDDGVGGALVDTYKGLEVKFQLDSLSPGRSYRCRVCAVSSGGQGVWSSEAVFVTPPTLPHPPTDLRVASKVTQSSTPLSWSRPAHDGGSPVTCYEVQSREGEGEWLAAGTVAEPLSFASPPPSPTSSLSHTLTHLTPGTQYSARVNCRSAVGASEWSVGVVFTTAPGAPSPPHTPTVAMVTAHSAQLQWAPSREFGRPVSGYEVEWSAGGGAWHTMSLPPAPCVASLTHLSPDTRHRARIKAVSEAGHSDWSSTSTFTTSPSTPSPPSHLALVSSSPSALLVAWSAPPSPGSPLTHYHLHLTPPPSPDSAHLVLLPSETQASLDGLRPSTQYTVRVQAENSMGLGPLSSPLTALTLPPPPLPPSLSLVSCTPQSLRVSWAKRTSKGLTYTLQVASEPDRFHTVFTGSAVSHKLTRLVPASRYVLRIAASSQSGQGAWSDHLICETPPPAPPNPANLVIQQEGDVIVMSWREVGHAHPVTYELQLKSGGQFTQVYRGPAPSHSHPITSHTRFQARVRACTSCHVNSRQEQLFSGFSPVASCECKVQEEASGVPGPAHIDNEDSRTEVGEQVEKGVWSHSWLALLFVGVSVAVVAMAIALGQLLVKQ